MEVVEFDPDSRVFAKHGRCVRERTCGPRSRPPLLEVREDASGSHVNSGRDVQQSAQCLPEGREGGRGGVCVCVCVCVEGVGSQG